MPLFGDSNFLQALGWAVLNSLWQMAFCWIIFQVILSFGINKPATKSRLATILLGAGFTWFMITLIKHWIIDPGAAKRSLFTITSFENGYTQWNEQLQTILPYASIAYLVLLIVPVLQFLRNYQFVQSIRTKGLSKCNVDLRIFVQRFAKRMGIRKMVHVYLSDLISSPVTIGFIKPIILMPLAAINHLSTKQVEAVLLHELAHIRRHDYFINLFVYFIRTILYFNPFVKLFTKTIEQEREKSCDELVIQFEYDPHGYASALLLLERNNFMRQSIAISASGQRNDLLHRVERILGMEKRKVPDLQRIGGLLAGFICIVGLNALFFFSSPVIQNHSLSFNSFSNPFSQLISDDNDYTSTKPIQNIKKENNTPEKTIAPETPKNNSLAKETQKPEIARIATPALAPDFVHVDARTVVLPELKKYQEEQVKGTIEATKKILEEGQWKQVEKNVADALTQLEKESLKEKYYTELEKVNWQELENKLRTAYNQINWEKVNLQVNTAITNIKLDSLTLLYSLTLDNLNKVENWMTENKCQSIPDTDLKLPEIKDQKEKLRQQLKTINSIRHRKIIHL